MRISDAPASSKTRWASMLSQYLLQIGEDSGLTREELLAKLKARLGSDNGLTCVTIGITDDYAFEANLFKDNGPEESAINCDFSDIINVLRIIKDSQVG